MLNKHTETMDRIETKILKYQKAAGEAAPIRHLSDDDVELYADYMTISGKEGEIFSHEESERLLAIEDHLFECDECDRKASQTIEWRKTVEKAAKRFFQADTMLQKQNHEIVAGILSELKVYFQELIADVLNMGEALRQLQISGYVAAAAFPRGGGIGGTDDGRDPISGRMVNGSFKLEIADIIKPEEKDLYSAKIVMKDGSEIMGRSEIVGNNVIFWFDNPDFEEDTEYDLKFEVKK